MTARPAAASGTLTPVPTLLAGLAAAGSAGLLAGAFAFQHLGGLAPCEMCLWQRWPHAVGIGLGLLMLVPFLREARVLRLIGLVAMVVGAGIALMHTGVERGWWQGVTECSGGPGGDLTADQLLEAIRAAPMVRCDEVAWSMLGLSMASWNGLISVALALLWAASLRRA
ncbi:MAG: disulfide bond formation protein B [Pseudomonadota bacterium]|nr:disulfide bond formation protein B [Pseudomonadota bacterium]MEE3100563.1 disulfide bond formation protein B [Pseudomonadota bacterium]